MGQLCSKSKESKSPAPRGAATDGEAGKEKTKEPKAKDAAKAKSFGGGGGDAKKASGDAKANKNTAAASKAGPSKPSWNALPPVARAKVKEQSRNPDDYLASKLEGTTWVRVPGEISDQRVNIEDCKNCVFVLLDQCDSVQVDDCVDCKFFIGPTMGSVFIRNCKNCTVIAACGQLRTRDVTDTRFALYCQSRPVIESSRGVGIGCFSSRHGYFQLLYQMCRARLSQFTNLYQHVHDFTPKGGNFHLLDQAAVDSPDFFPLLSELLPEHIAAEEDAALFESEAVIPFTSGARGLIGAAATLLLFAPGCVDAARAFVAAVELQRRRDPTAAQMHFSVEHTCQGEVPESFAGRMARLGIPAAAIASLKNETFIMVIYSCREDAPVAAPEQGCVLHSGPVASELLADVCTSLFVDMPLQGKGFGASH